MGNVFEEKEAFEYVFYFFEYSTKKYHFVFYVRSRRHAILRRRPDCYSKAKEERNQFKKEEKHEFVVTIDFDKNDQRLWSNLSKGSLSKKKTNILKFKYDDKFKMVTVTSLKLTKF